MAQIYKIYINETVLILTESVSNSLPDVERIEPAEFNFDEFYASRRSDSSAATYVIQTPNPKSLFKQIKNPLKIIKAAGGLVKDEYERCLFIFRKGKWDLPKGKLDEGEKTKDAAVREVEEECGIRINEAGKKLCKTYHVYELDGRTVLKKTTWYRMFAYNQPDLTPQIAEDISDARWLATGEFALVRQNTYPLIRDVMVFAEE